MRKLNLLVLMFCLLPMLVVAERQSAKGMTDFILQQSYIRYNKIFVATVVKSYPAGYRKAEMSFDVAALKVSRYYKVKDFVKNKAKINSVSKKEFVIYLGDIVKLRVGQKYLFFVTPKGFVGVGDPPLLIKRGRVKSKHLSFKVSVLPAIFALAKKAVPSKLRKKYYQEAARKRVIDRKLVAAFKQAVQVKLLQEQIKGVAVVSQKINLAFQIADRLKQLTRYGEAKKYYDLVLKQKSLTAKEKFKAKHGLALLLYYKGSKNMAISALQVLAKEFQFTPIALATVYVDLGRLHEMKGAVKASVVYYKKATMFAAESPQQAAFACYNLGEIEKKRKNYEKEKLYYKKAIYIFDKLIKKDSGKKLPGYYSYMKDRLKVK